MSEQSEIQFQLFQMMAKAKKAGKMTTDSAGNNTYELEPKDRVALKAASFKRYENIEFQKDGTLIQTSGKDPAGVTTDKLPKAYPWDNYSMIYRVALCKSIGLEGKTASKAFKDISPFDQAKIIKFRESGKVPEATPKLVHPTPEPVKSARKPVKKPEEYGSAAEAITALPEKPGKESKTSKADKATGTDKKSGKDTETTPVKTGKSKHKDKGAPKPALKDLLMWVGANSYPTYKSYVRESKEMGCSKRIGTKFPHNIVPGTTRVFLAHDDGIVERGFIFGYFIIKELQIIVSDETDADWDLPDEIASIVTWLDAKKVADEPERGCGWRSEGGVYLTGDEVTKLRHFIDVDAIARRKQHEDGSDFRQRFRGALKINGDKVLKSEAYVKAPSKELKQSDGGEWDESTNKALKKHLKAKLEDQAMSTALTIFALTNGFPKSTVLYHYNLLFGGE